MDRFYTSMQLLVDLKLRSIGGCGTIQSNRLHLREEEKDEIQKLTDRGIMYMKGPQGLLLSVWKDSKNVLLLSNYHQPVEESKERQLRKKDITPNTRPNEKQFVNIPRAIIDYTANVGGVDSFDQKSNYYSPQLRSHRWYIKIFFHFLEIAVLNSYVIYKKVCEENRHKSIMSQLEFRKGVIRQLISELRTQNNVPSTHKKVSSRSSIQNTVRIELSTVKKKHR